MISPMICTLYAIEGSTRDPSTKADRFKTRWSGSRTYSDRENQAVDPWVQYDS